MTESMHEVGGLEGSVLFIDAVTYAADRSSTAPRPLASADPLDRLNEVLVRVSEADSLELLLVEILAAVVELTSCDAAAVDVAGLAPGQNDRVVVYSGLTRAEAALLGGAGSELELARLGRATGAEIRWGAESRGHLWMWRVGRPLDPDDLRRRRIAASAVAVVVQESLRRTQAGQRQAWLAAAAEIADGLVGQEPVRCLLQLIADRVLQVATCDAVWIVGGSDPQSLALQAIAGTDVDLDQLRGLDWSRSMVAETVRTQRVIHVPDIARDPRTLREDGSTRWPRMGPTVMLPLLAAGEVLGGMGLGWRRGRTVPYRALAPDLPERFAEQAVIAVRIGRAREQLARLTVLEERDRIRLDLHDRVIQQLYGLGMTLEACRGRPDPAVLDNAVERVDQAITEIRRTVAGIGVLDDGMRLYDQLVAVIDRAAAVAPFRAELRVTGLSAASVPDPVAEHLLAVAQEALSNVNRHARASRCRVTLDVGAQVELVVDDDGIGIPDGVVGSGLANVRRRAEVHGGQASLTRLDPGTRLRWTVPLSG